MRSDGWNETKDDSPIVDRWVIGADFNGYIGIFRLVRNEYGLVWEEVGSEGGVINFS